MLKHVRIILIVLFCLSLAGASGLYFYVYTHEDTSPPAFRSDSELLELSVTDPEQAMLRGLRAYDNVDGDLTGKIRIRDVSPLINERDVTVSYIVFDEASNYATYSRTVRYVDYESPTFRLLQPLVFRAGEPISFTSTVAVMDQRDGDITGRLKLEESAVISNSPGSYAAKFSATNRMGDTVYLPVTVQIVSNSASMPEIKLTDYLIYISQGERPVFRRYLREVVDPLLPEKHISLSSVAINSTKLDVNTPGVYEVYYYYTGSSGETTTVILTVIVK